MVDSNVSLNECQAAFDKYMETAFKGKISYLKEIVFAAWKTSWDIGEARYNELLQSSKDFMKESGKYDATLETALNQKKELLDRLIYVAYNPEECGWDVLLNLGTASVKGQNAIVIQQFAREEHAKLFRDAIMGERANLVRAAGDAGKNQETGEHQAQHSGVTPGSPDTHTLILAREALSGYVEAYHQRTHPDNDKPGYTVRVWTTDWIRGKDAIRAIDKELAKPQAAPSEITENDEDIFPPYMLEQWCGSSIGGFDTTKTYNVTGTHLKQLMEGYKKLYHAKLPKREYSPAWQPMSTAPRDTTKIFLRFSMLDYAPIASWEQMEGGVNEYDAGTFAWCFKDDSFGENGDGWLYEDDPQPIGWMPVNDIEDGSHAE